MFNIFKRKAKMVTEADFDVFEEFTFHEVTFTKAEVSLLYMLWTQEPRGMLVESLALMLPKRCTDFSLQHGDREPHEVNSYAKVFAGGLIDHLKKLKLIQKSGSKYSSKHKITERGEQIRQFYILKNGLGRSIYSRMDKFEAA